jgi:hypothetical protein
MPAFFSAFSFGQLRCDKTSCGEVLQLGGQLVDHDRREL